MSMERTTLFEAAVVGGAILLSSAPEATPLRAVDSFPSENPATTIVVENKNPLDFFEPKDSDIEQTPEPTPEHEFGLAFVKPQAEISAEDVARFIDQHKELDPKDILPLLEAISQSTAEAQYIAGDKWDGLTLDEATLIFKPSLHLTFNDIDGSVSITNVVRNSETVTNASGKTLSPNSILFLYSGENESIQIAEVEPKSTDDIGFVDTNKDNTSLLVTISNDGLVYKDVLVQDLDGNLKFEPLINHIEGVEASNRLPSMQFRSIRIKNTAIVSSLKSTFGTSENRVSAETENYLESAVYLDQESLSQCSEEAVSGVEVTLKGGDKFTFCTDIPELKNLFYLWDMPQLAKELTQLEVDNNNGYAKEHIIRINDLRKEIQSPSPKFMNTAWSEIITGPNNEPFIQMANPDTTNVTEYSYDIYFNPDVIDPNTSLWKSFDYGAPYGVINQGDMVLGGNILGAIIDRDPNISHYDTMFYKLGQMPALYMRYYYNQTSS
jgi:hypothetical protein